MIKGSDQPNTSPQRHVVGNGFFKKGRLILVGASTGGVDALVRLLSDYSQNGPPLLIVQHTGAKFSKSLVRLLDRDTMVNVMSAEDGVLLQHGCAYLAPSTQVHLCVSETMPFRCRLVQSQPSGGHRPSANVLFHSAVPHAKRISAAVLTGMGRDGADGLLALRKAGAKTFAQDEASSVVYGMPAAAVRLGAVEKEVGIDAMARNLLETCLSHKSIQR